MITAREDINNGTKESIAEWGFSVLLVYPSGKTITPTANGRKTSMDISSEGLQIVNNNPYLSIPIDSLEGNEIPDKGCKVKAPVDFFRPDSDPANWIWYAVERASKTDDDWFVKIYLSSTEQAPE
ncbi:hypothetical protein KA005_16740 [bacterium]|nr:hypothetical protein [bacterium]